MRRIGTIPSQEDAERFRDYLLTRDVQSQVEAAGDDWAVWIYDEDQVESARAELQSFVLSPEDEKYRQAVIAADRIRHEKVRAASAARKKQVNLAQRWNRPLIRQIPLTFGLVVISTLVTLGTQFGSQMDSFGGKLTMIEVRSRGADAWQPVDPETGGPRHVHGLAEIRHGQVWRLITPIFIHLSPWHLLFNMYWTVVFGSLIETRQGFWTLLGVVVVTAVLSNLAQYAFKGFGFGGFSGVGFGLFGYVWVLGRTSARPDMQLSPNMVFLWLAWLLMCMTGIVGPIANYAHVVGLLTGGLIGGLRGGWEKIGSSL